MSARLQDATERARDVSRRAWPVLAPFFTAQAVIQVTGAAAGLVFVRVLPVREFALYTIAASVTSFFTFLTDLGATGSLFFFYRHSSEHGFAFEPYVGAVRSLRRSVLLVGSVMVLAVLPAWLRGQGFGAVTLLALAVLTVLTVHYQIESALGITRLRLQGGYGRAYAAEVTGAVLRLVLAGLVAVVAPRTAAVALATGACAAAGSALVARRGLRGGTREAAVPSAMHRNEVLRYLLPGLPSSVHFAVQGPLVVWLAATFGGITNVAAVGALGRLSMLVAAFSALTPTLFLVQLAHTTDPALYKRRFLQFGAGLAAIGAALVAAGLIAPDALLWLLGPSYRGLRGELVIALGTAALTLLGGYAAAVVASRSWLRLNPIATAVLVAAQVAAAAAVRLDTTAGVLLFGLVSAAVGLAAQLAILALGFSRPALVFNSPRRASASPSAQSTDVPGRGL